MTEIGIPWWYNDVSFLPTHHYHENLNYMDKTKIRNHEEKNFGKHIFQRQSREALIMSYSEETER